MKVYSKSKSSSAMDKKAMEQWKRDIQEARKAQELWLKKIANESEEKPGK